MTYEMVLAYSHAYESIVPQATWGRTGKGGASPRALSPEFPMTESFVIESNSQASQSHLKHINHQCHVI